MNKKQLPNVLTCMNLLCGCVAIISVFHGNVVLMAGMVFLAALFDFMDGLTARSLNVYSELGKNLDSLADVVTFGVVPGMILYNLFIKQPDQEFLGSFTLFHLLKYFPFVVTVFAAYRLAKFNTDTRPKHVFYGLPVPAAGILVTSFPLIVRFDNFGLGSLIMHPVFLLVASVVLSYLMISDLQLFSLKFANMGWKDNKIRFIFLGISLVLVIVLQFTAIPIIICLYVLLSVIRYYLMKNAPA